MTADVIVIGAGPAGTSAGKQIARAGYEVIIMDKRCSSVRPNEALGGVMPKKCFTDLGLPRDIVENECQDLTYHFPMEQIHVSKRSGFVLFDRTAFDQLLIQKAKEEGAKFMDSTLVFDVAKCDNGIRVQYEQISAGKTQKDRARIVIFADGASTLAYTKFQIGFDAGLETTALGAAYDLEYEENDLLSMDFFFSENVSPFGYGWIFPRKGKVNVGFLCPMSKMKSEIRRYLDSFVSSKALGGRRIIGYVSRHMPQFYVEQLHSDSVLVAGDAAGTADPIDGGGISNAVVSGQVAGKVAVEALEEKDVTADFLSKYQNEWKKTENFRLFLRSYLLQRLALKAEVNIGVFLKQMGFFERHIQTG